MGRLVWHLFPSPSLQDLILQSNSHFLTAKRQLFPISSTHPYVIVGFDPTIQIGAGQGAKCARSDVHIWIPAFAGMTAEVGVSASHFLPSELHKIHKFTIYNVKSVFLFTLSAL